MSLPTPLIAYPRTTINGSVGDDGEEHDFQDYYGTPEEEIEAVDKYFKLNAPCSRRAVHKFVKDYYEDVTPIFRNPQVDTIATCDTDKFDFAYWGYQSLFQTTDKEKIRSIGENLYDLGGEEVMRASFYLLCWDTQNAGTTIKGWRRMVEHYWDGIGEWMA